MKNIIMNNTVKIELTDDKNERRSLINAAKRIKRSLVKSDWKGDIEEVHLLGSLLDLIAEK